MSYYQNYLKHFAKLNFHISQISEWIKRNQIDYIYNALLLAEKEIQFVQPILKELNDPAPELFEHALTNITKQKDTVLSFFESWFENNPFLGDALAFKSPDLAILLGASQTILEHRTQAAIEYLKNYPNIPILFSGGGFSSTESEAVIMQRYAQEAGLKNPMLLEDKSMDTLGNALFSKLELIRGHQLSKINKVLILTSHFHTPRVLHYFQRIYNSDHARSIAAYGIATPNINLRKITAHELTSEYRADTRLGILDTHPKNPIDDQAILLKLFKNHALYQNRYDLLERYLPIA